MPQILISRKNIVLNAEIGSTLMRVLLDGGLPVASSCNGDGICAKCKINILRGGELLSSIEFTEQVLRDKFSLQSQQRISCQTKIIADGIIEVDASYW